MRVIKGLGLLIMLVLPAAANGQSFALYGSAGPTITDKGNSFAVGAGVSATSRFDFVFSFDRTHLSSRTSREGDVVSHFRGGTLQLGTAEVRFMPFGHARVGPFALAGAAAGVSRPNVNEVFPNRITNGVRAVFFGGGINVPFGERFALVADVRMMAGSEGLEGVVAVAPVRGGIVWRF